MKVLVYANVDGDYETLKEVYKQVAGINMAICVGNFPLVSKSTPLDKFYKGSFVNEGQTAKQFMEGNTQLPALTYAMYGEYDDPYIPSHEWTISNMIPIRHYLSVNMISYAKHILQDTEKEYDIPVTKSVRVGFLGGYYSNALYGNINQNRLNRDRSRKSLAICDSDVNGVSGSPLEFLFTFEAPSQYDGQVKFRGGTNKIDSVIEKTKPVIHFHAHMRDASIGYIKDTLSIGIPSLRDGFYLLDLYTGKVASCRPGLDKHLEVYENTKKSI